MLSSTVLCGIERFVWPTGVLSHPWNVRATGALVFASWWRAVDAYGCYRWRKIKFPPPGGRGALKGHEAVVEEAVVVIFITGLIVDLNSCSRSCSGASSTRGSGSGSIGVGGCSSSGCGCSSRCRRGCCGSRRSILDHSSAVWVVVLHPTQCMHCVENSLHVVLKAMARSL